MAVDAVNEEAVQKAVSNPFSIEPVGVDIQDLLVDFVSGVYDVFVAIIKMAQAGIENRKPCNPMINVHIVGMVDGVEVSMDR